MILDEVMVIEAAQGKPRASGDDPHREQRSEHKEQ